MVIKKETIQRIKDIIERRYRHLTLSLLGSGVLSAEDLAALKARGVDTSSKGSFLELVYNHSFMNPPGNPAAPTSAKDAEAQQRPSGAKPAGEAHDYAVEHANENAAQLLDRMRVDVATRVESIIRETNNKYKSNALQNLVRPEEADELVKESMVGEIKQRLRDTAGDANRDWTRIAVTEVSNVIGIGSTDRIVAQNKDKNLQEVYVFRVTVSDATTCKWCRNFYLDADGSPKVYRLSTLLANGSNYGKRTSDWRPVIQATHPNERCSQVVELPPGYKVLPGGKLTYIGVDAFGEYISNKLTA